MEVRFVIPDEIAAQLLPNGKDISRFVLEMVALEGYKSGELTAHQVQQMLGFDSRVEVDGFLKAHGITSELTPEEFERQTAFLESLLS
ncbi:MAG: UPF0175 family protein, partial [Blastocatellia bacterium]